MYSILTSSRIVWVVPFICDRGVLGPKAFRAFGDQARKQGMVLATEASSRSRTRTRSWHEVIYAVAGEPGSAKVRPPKSTATPHRCLYGYGHPSFCRPPHDRPPTRPPPN